MESSPQPKLCLKKCRPPDYEKVEKQKFSI